jgi:hypothetical protein
MTNKIHQSATIGSKVPWEDVDISFAGYLCLERLVQPTTRSPLPISIISPFSAPFLSSPEGPHPHAHPTLELDLSKIGGLMLLT